MKIRTLFFTLAFILAALPALVAKIVTKEQAQVVAQNFFIERINSKQVNWNANNLVVSDINTFEAEGQPAIYAFSNNGQGFILVSAEDAMTPILGYAYEGSLSVPGENPNFEDLLSEYLAQVKFIRSNSMSASTDVQNAWSTYLNGQSDYSPLADTTTVGPLITTMWDQTFPYNEFCPVDPNGPGGHVYTGCVATAMSMIMNYYKYPITGNGQHSYNAPGYGTQTVNFGATTYNWDALQNSMNSSSGAGIPEIALLMYHVGVSVNMGYGVDPGSGAYSNDVPYALKTYFKYASSAQYTQRSGTSTTNWENMLMEQLDANRPIYYSGSNPDGGHAWVCDGYQKIGSAKMFHFNFGWSGSDNGYYTSNNANGFTSGQAMVRNIYPNAAYYPYGCTAKTLDFPKGSIEDGSGPIDSYSNNLSCTWLIAPVDTVNSITVTFMRFDLSSSDSLYFYDGEDASAPLLAAYSGSTLPTDVTSSGDRLFVQFVTDGTIQSDGWMFEYSSALPNLCSGTKTMDEPSGSFTDGSGEYNYKNNSLCKFKILPPYAMNLTLSFDEFELLTNDEIEVSSLATSELIATLTGSEIPDPITVPIGGLYLVFKTNSYYAGAGFKASYAVGNVGSTELAGISSLNIAPNPASEFVMVRASNSKTQQMQLLLNNMAGVNLYNETFTAQKGSIEKSIDVSNLNAGMYFLTVKTAEGKATQKVIVK
jgi:hypothetical protein